MYLTDQYITEVQRQYLADAQQYRLLAEARKARRERRRRAPARGVSRIAYVFRPRARSVPAQPAP